MRLAILGSTGSIGVNTLQVVREMGPGTEVVSLAAGRNLEELLRQALEFRPQVISVADETCRVRFQALLQQQLGVSGYRPELLHGREGNLAAVQAVECDVVVSAAVGVAGLEATFEAVRLGKRLALANKEVMVAAGELVMREAGRTGAEVLPVDSEHNGLHQCLRAGDRKEVAKVILTASGGPFRTMPLAELDRVTPEAALNHPTWKMGRRISIDSATLMNKGFEVIEACRLFDLRPSEIEVVVHPQSIVHALVEFIDGSVVAQLAPPDMKLPIRYALSYPERQAGGLERLRWDRVRQLDFEPPDRRKFPLLGLAYRALEIGGTAGCILNAADEIAVEAFLDERIPFPAISRIVESVLEQSSIDQPESVKDVLAADRTARELARKAVRDSSVRVGLGP
ncbi:MAG: 1-deoxy-D-xylulose-5-phosphate reductoisomerase [Acidobacteria bacterium]|nr:1-deoxy-D-xylulose-5-phosphate reductoisomerase [Acidobacteriota bacterium]